MISHGFELEESEQVEARLPYKTQDVTKSELEPAQFHISKFYSRIGNPV